jgi:hypothetical protein
MRPRFVVSESAVDPFRRQFHSIARVNNNTAVGGEDMGHSATRRPEVFPQL